MAAKSRRKVPAKVPAQTVLAGLKRVQKDRFGLRLTVIATHL